MRIILSIFICVTAITLTYLSNSTEIVTTASKSYTRVIQLLKQSKARPFTTPQPTTHQPMTNTTAMSTPRAIQKTFLAREQSEGAGATVRRRDACEVYGRAGEAVG